MKPNTIELNSIYDTSSLTSYKEWKNRRKMLTSSLGQILISLNEEELSQIFSQWEFQIQIHKNANEEPKQFLCLLIISLLHFFKWSFETARKNFATIVHFASSQSSDVCRSAIYILRMLAIESKDYYTFLREMLDIIKKWITQPFKQNFLFNILYSLGEIGRFLPNEVFMIFFYHLSELYFAVSSSDPKISTAASKVLDIYFSQLPSKIAIESAKTAIKESIQQLNDNCNIALFKGRFIILNVLFKRYPQALCPQDFVNRVIEISKISTDIPNLPETCFSFLTSAIKINPNSFSKPQTISIVKAFCDNILETDNRPKFLKMLKTMIQNIKISRYGTKIIVKLCYTLLSQINNSSNVDHSSKQEKSSKFESPKKKKEKHSQQENLKEKTHNKPKEQDKESHKDQFNNFKLLKDHDQKENDSVFEILHVLLSQNSDLILPISIFLISRPCKYYIKVLKKHQQYIEKLKKKLVSFFSISQRTEEQIQDQCDLIDLETSLRLVQAFGTSIFPNIEEIFNDIHHYIFVSNEGIRRLVAKALPTFPYKEATIDLFHMSAYDESKYVRLGAIKALRQLKININEIDETIIPQLLSDSSFKVRREVIPLIAEISEQKPFYCVSATIRFFNDFLIPTIIGDDIIQSAKACSLLPLIAKYLSSYSIYVINNLLYISTLFLMPNHQIDKIDLKLVSKLQEAQTKLSHQSSSSSIINSSCSCNFEIYDLRNIVHLDILHENYSQNSNINSQDDLKKSKIIFNLNKVLEIENENWILKRNTYLFKTLDQLAHYIKPYINQIMPAFLHNLTFSSDKFCRKNMAGINNVFIAALSALRHFVVINESEINLVKQFPQLHSILLQLLNKTTSNEVAISVFKLTGSLGICSSIFNQENDELDVKHLFELKNPSFTTNYILTLLTKMLKSDPSSAVFTTISLIFSIDIENSLPFLKQVLQAFVDEILHAPSNRVVFLLKDLRTIIEKSTIYIEPFLTILFPILKHYLDNIYCLQIVLIISKSIGEGFIPFSHELFLIALNFLVRDSCSDENKKPLFFDERINYEMSSSKSNLGSTLVNEKTKQSSSKTSKDEIPVPRPRKFSLRSNENPYPENPISKKPASAKRYHKMISYNSLSKFNSHIQDSFKKFDIHYFSLLLKLIALLILKQHQSIDQFLGVVPSLFSDQFKVSKVLKILSAMIQTGSVNSYAARIGQICFPLLRQKPINSELIQLLYNLIVYCHVPHEAIEQRCKFYKIIINIPSDISHLIKPRSLELKFLNNDGNENSSNKKSCKKDPFANLVAPDINCTRKWLEDIFNQVILYNPTQEIRACCGIIEQSEYFKREIFPVAFLVCWRKASPETKHNISAIFTKIIEDSDTVAPEIIDLAELLNRAGEPLLEDEVEAKVCSSALALYHLQKYHLSHPDDMKTVSLLLPLSARLGQEESARYLLSEVSDKIDRKTLALWCEQLNDWETALNIYLEDNNIIGTIKCYSQLQMWDKIRELQSSFDKMKHEDQKKVALCFSTAWFKNNEIHRPSSLLLFSDPQDFPTLLFSIELSIIKRDKEKAFNLIDEAYYRLTLNRSFFDGSDEKQASLQLEYAQQVVELEECALFTFKKNIYTTITTNTQIENIWARRLSNFPHMSNSLANIMEIHSILLTPEQYAVSFIKLLAVLRKERKWGLIKQFTEIYKIRNSTTSLTEKTWLNPRVVSALLKVEWAKGNKEISIQFIDLLNSMINDPDNAQNLYNSSQLDSSFKCFLSPNRDFLNSYNSQAARLLRLQASWQFQIGQKDLDSYTHIYEIFEKSIGINSKDFRTWVGWGYTCEAALSTIKYSSSIDEQNVETYDSSILVDFNDLTQNKLIQKFARSAISCFLKACILKPRYSLEYLCQIFSIFFKYGSMIDQSLIENLLSIKELSIVKIVPQLVSQIGHEYPQVNEVVSSLLLRLGGKHYETVAFAINVLSELHEEKARTAKNILLQLGSLENNRIISNEFACFVEGMKNAAFSLWEVWINLIDKMSTLYKSGQRENAIQLLEHQLKLINHPLCEMDKEFYSIHSKTLSKIKRGLIKYNEINELDEKNKWKIFYQILYDFYNDLDNEIKKWQCLLLSRISPQLESHKDFLMAIPGKYSVSEDYPKIHQIENELQILSSQMHPRRVQMLDYSGKRWKFLLKGNEDLRLDERIIQFFSLINLLLMKNIGHSSFLSSDSKIIEYSVIPFTANAGLISWVNGADTMQQLVCDFRSSRNIPIKLENELVNESISDFYNHLNSLQKYEIFQCIASKTECNELREVLWLRCPSAPQWIERNRNFTLSSAIMSMAGYIIGLGDRHPSNIMIQRHTGRIIHIDFGDSFEKAMRRPNYPEKVPFRLTRMIEKALDGGTVGGLFTQKCEDVLWALRESRRSVYAQLEVFVHEPIFFERGSSLNDVMERVVQKLSGVDHLSHTEKGKTTVQGVQTQVNNLIQLARDQFSYCQHYIGWCPFW